MIHFAAPNNLLLFLLIPILIMFLNWRRRKQARLMEQFASNGLLARLVQRADPSVRWWKTFLPVLILALFSLALARPQYGQKEQIVKRKGMDIVVALDTSDSMLAEDLRPDRLRVAKREIGELIDKLEGDRIALIPFAGEAFVQCPLTLDYGAAKMFLQEVDTNTISMPGTAIGRAIDTAIQSFVQEDRKYKVLILITDGEDTISDPGPIEAAKKAAEQGIRIYPIGVGTIDGVPIPIRNEKNELIGYKQTKQGDKVLSRLDEATLRQVALETDGAFYHATNDRMELDMIYDEIRQMEEKDLHSTVHVQGIDRFQYPLGTALILLILELFLVERKRASKQLPSGGVL